MPKLNTAALKAMIPTWVGSPSARELLRCHSDFSRDGTPPEQATLLARACEWFELPVGSSAARLEAHVWSLWCDPKQWKRVEKRRLKDEWSSYFHETCECSRDPGFDPVLHDLPCPRDRAIALSVDMLGSCDYELLDRMLDQHTGEVLTRCWLRVFVPDNDLADNYRLEVVTTPDDDAVIGWTVITD